MMTLRPEDFVNSLQVHAGAAQRRRATVDDIDHLGNRRLRTIDELAADELRKGFLKLRRTVQERMSLKDPETIGKIAELVNSKSISSRASTSSSAAASCRRWSTRPTRSASSRTSGGCRPWARAA